MSSACQDPSAAPRPATINEAGIDAQAVELGPHTSRTHGTITVQFVALTIEEWRVERRAGGGAHAANCWAFGYRLFAVKPAAAYGRPAFVQGLSRPIRPFAVEGVARGRAVPCLTTVDGQARVQRRRVGKVPVLDKKDRYALG